jgi:hypothetical protein
MRKVLRASLALCVLGVLLTGCGGGGSSEETSKVTRLDKIELYGNKYDNDGGGSSTEWLSSDEGLSLVTLLPSGVLKNKTRYGITVTATGDKALQNFNGRFYYHTSSDWVDLTDWSYPHQDSQPVPLGAFTVTKTLMTTANASVAGADLAKSYLRIENRDAPVSGDNVDDIRKTVYATLTGVSIRIVESPATETLDLLVVAADNRAQTSVISLVPYISGFSKCTAGKSYKFTFSGNSSARLGAADFRIYGGVPGFDDTISNISYNDGKRNVIPAGKFNCEFVYTAPMTSDTLTENWQSLTLRIRNFDPLPPGAVNGQKTATVSDLRISITEVK